MSAHSGSLPPNRSFAAGTWLAWLVIGACVVMIVAAGLRPQPAEPLAVEPDRTATISTDFLIQSRLAVGAAEVLEPGTIDAGGSSPVEALLGSVDQAAGRSPAGRLRAAIVAGEVHGGSAALQRLDLLATEELPPHVAYDVTLLQDLYARGDDSITQQQQTELLERHGWFARLALTSSLPEDQPERRAVRAPAVRAAWTGAILLMLGAAGVMAGLVLLLPALARFAAGQLRAHYAPPAPGQSGPFVEAFAVYLVSTILISIVMASLLHDPPLAANFLLALAVIPAVLWPRWRGLSWAEVRAGLGWHGGRGWVREIGCGILGYIAGLPLLALAVFVTSMLVRATGTTPTHPIVDDAAGGAGGNVRVIQLYLLAAVYAPVAEELMFRGALYHHVRGWLGWFTSAVLVGLIFAAIHPQGWVGIPMLGTIALVLAVLREWRGSIIAPVVAHACVNGVTITMLVLMAG